MVLSCYISHRLRPLLDSMGTTLSSKHSPTETSIDVAAPRAGLPECARISPYKRRPRLLTVIQHISSASGIGPTGPRVEGSACAYIIRVTIRNPSLYLSQAPMYTRDVVPQQHCSISPFLTGFLVSSRCASLTSPSVVTMEKKLGLRLTEHTQTRLPRGGVL